MQNEIVCPAAFLLPGPPTHHLKYEVNYALHLRAVAYTPQTLFLLHIKRIAAWFHCPERYRSSSVLMSQRDNGVFAPDGAGTIPTWHLTVTLCLQTQVSSSCYVVSGSSSSVLGSWLS